MSRPSGSTSARGSGCAEAARPGSASTQNSSGTSEGRPRPGTTNRSHETGATTSNGDTPGGYQNESSHGNSSASYVGYFVVEDELAGGTPMERFLGERHDSHVTNTVSFTTEDDSWSTAAVADSDDLGQR
ncbi:hypothetical protein NQ176_g7791 [Zarea fungicola]|uniref:Uncharacterized protein n=1 Tax=Zarea fungicola TaxID=93591 RepID=A0ACC1MYI6_9HYPO|nr:hypothetical protein NQ176_g7791 [Lecanicillium fungicola]